VKTSAADTSFKVLLRGYEDSIEALSRLYEGAIETSAADTSFQVLLRLY
jgi:hypothetical protein